MGNIQTIDEQTEQKQEANLPTYVQNIAQTLTEATKTPVHSSSSSSSSSCASCCSSSSCLEVGKEQIQTVTTVDLTLQEEKPRCQSLDDQSLIDPPSLVETKKNKETTLSKRRDTPQYVRKLVNALVMPDKDDDTTSTCSSSSSSCSSCSSQLEG